MDGKFYRYAIDELNKLGLDLSYGGNLIRDDVAVRIKENINDALIRGKYQKAILEGRMTANDAKTIIESAGLKVPKDILDLAKPETPVSVD